MESPAIPERTERAMNLHDVMKDASEQAGIVLDATALVADFENARRDIACALGIERADVGTVVRWVRYDDRTAYPTLRDSANLEREYLANPHQFVGVVAAYDDGMGESADADAAREQQQLPCGCGAVFCCGKHDEALAQWAWERLGQVS